LLCRRAFNRPCAGLLIGLSKAYTGKSRAIAIAFRVRIHRRWEFLTGTYATTNNFLVYRVKLRGKIIDEMLNCRYFVKLSSQLTCMLTPEIIVMRMN